MSGSRKYYLRQYSQEKYWHGGIGYTHIENILEEKGYVPIELPATPRIPVLLFIIRFFKMVSICLDAKPADRWAFIYPVYGRLNRWMIKWLNRKKVNTLCIVGDIDGLKDEDPAQLKKDIRFFLRQPSLVVHNDNMEEWARSMGYRGWVYQLTLFDFLSRPSDRRRELSRTVVFAGNLHKSPFVYQLSQPALKDIQFLVYGAGGDSTRAWPRNVEFKGSYAPSQLPNVVEGSFGLLWDGDSWDTPAGPIGKYMPYITHHKVSLYILAGLPILVPRIAGSASFIEKNGLGILIDDLSMIEPAIQQISEEDYRRMRTNLSIWSKRILNGFQLKDVLSEWEKR